MMSRKRKIAVLATVFSLALFTVGYGFAFPTAALAWDNCPKGQNCSFPGLCGRYVDTNGDDICDLGQPKPVSNTTTTTEALPAETTTTTVKKRATTTTTAEAKQPESTTTSPLAVTTVTAGDPPTGPCPLGACASCGACISGGIVADAATVDSDDASSAGLSAAAAGILASDDTSATTSTTAPAGGTTSDDSAAADDGLAATESAASSVALVATSAGGGFLTHYLVSPIAIGFFLIYGVSFFLYKTKRIRMATHRKIWNVLLAATFLITGIFGTVLAFQIDYAPLYMWPINLLFWHVETGIVMTFISLFHLAWHFKYYKAMVKNAREKWRVLRSTQKEFDLADGQLVLEAREARRSDRHARRNPREARLEQLAQRGAPVSVRVEQVSRATAAPEAVTRPVWQQSRQVAMPGRPLDLGSE